MASSSPRFGNYGTPSPSHRPGLYSPRLTDLHKLCTWHYEDVQTAFPSFIMNHFANNSVYDAFNGTDYTPHNLKNYPEHSHWRKGLRPQPPGSPKIVGSLCDIADTDAPANGRGERMHYTLMRVGPFTSNGGYDWWHHFCPCSITSRYNAIHIRRPILLVFVIE